LFDQGSPLPVTTERFEERLTEARVRLRHVVPQLLNALPALFDTYREIRLMPDAYPGMEADLARLIAPDFLQRTPFDQLPHVSRYLKAIQMRAERAKLGPQKDLQKAEQVQPFQDAVDDLQKEDCSSAKRAAIDEFRWIVEEFRVSVFAQELGTAQKVSAKRLQEKLEQVRMMR